MEDKTDCRPGCGPAWRLDDDDRRCRPRPRRRTFQWRHGRLSTSAGLAATLSNRQEEVTRKAEVHCVRNSLKRRKATQSPENWRGRGPDARDHPWDWSDFPRPRGSASNVGHPQRKRYEICTGRIHTRAAARLTQTPTLWMRKLQLMHKTASCHEVQVCLLSSTAPARCCSGADAGLLRRCRSRMASLKLAHRRDAGLR